MEEIRALAAALPTRRAIADAVCDALGWHRADGRRKDMTARVALNRMHADGLITLPPPRHGNSNGRHLRHGPAGQLALPIGPAPVTATLAQIAPLQLVPVTSRADSARYNQLIRDQHYLATPRWPALSSATSSRPARAPSERSASAPPPGSAPPATPTSAGTRPPARPTCT